MKHRADPYDAGASSARLLNILLLLGTLACYFVAGGAEADDGRAKDTWADNTYLGQLSTNPYNADSTSNPYGAGNPYDANSINNPYGEYGSPYSNKSATNPYATDAPKLYDDNGNYRGRLSANPYDAESTSNPYGQYGSPYSADSINNPYGAGNPYRADSPTNPYGHGLGIYDGESEGPADDTVDVFEADDWSAPSQVSPLESFSTYDGDYDYGYED